ncbi:MAG: hypothetical protein LBB76_06625 [Azoarcus sp.]|nr:hypothetical protein [Azoarcus sp.]
MKFNHTYVVHSCVKCREFSHTSNGSPNWSWYYLFLALGAAIPLWLFAVFADLLPWYHFFGVLAAEMILSYVAGSIAGLLLMFRNNPPAKCPKCGSDLVPGSYYAEGKMNFDDLMDTIIYIGINVRIWISLLA